QRGDERRHATRRRRSTQGRSSIHERDRAAGRSRGGGNRGGKGHRLAVSGRVQRGAQRDRSRRLIHHLTQGRGGAAREINAPVVHRRHGRSAYGQSLRGQGCNTAHQRRCTPGRSSIHERDLAAGRSRGGGNGGGKGHRLAVSGRVQRGAQRDRSRRLIHHLTQGRGGAAREINAPVVHRRHRRSAYGQSLRGQGCNTAHQR